MSRPRLLDLFCCEGGAAVGYERAGFEVYGVDLEPRFRRRYPFPIHIGDALEVLAKLGRGEAIDFTHPGGRVEWLTVEEFAARHASPPCQGYSVATRGNPEARAKHPRLVEPVREALVASGLPWVIENVVGAPLLDPMMLCGSMFGLTATDDDGTLLRLERHRLFESNILLTPPDLPHHHDKAIPVGGVYGGGRQDRWEAKHVRRGGYTPAKHVREALIGVDHMTLHGLSQSIPPAYTEHIGRQLIEHIEWRHAA